MVLDLFCGAGGAAEGYHRAGWEVVGVDSAPQPRYPFTFYRMDWRDGLRQFGTLAQLIHASPPCKVHTRMRGQWPAHTWVNELTPTLNALMALGRPYVVENVPGAPFTPNLILCGSMFGLKVRRHRWFQTSTLVTAPPCDHKGQGSVVQVNGHTGGSSTRDGVRHTLADWREAMDIEWMTMREISQAIPPAYTEHIARGMTGVGQVAV